MKRRDFLKLSGAASVSLLTGGQGSYADDNRKQTFYVAVDGDDRQPGTIDHPFSTLQQAQRAVRRIRSANPGLTASVIVRQGTYYLNEPLTFTAEDSGTAEAPVVYSAYPGEKVTLSGGRPLACNWQTRKSKSICDLTAANKGPFAFTQLFINGKRRMRARFPDADQAGSQYVNVVRPLPPSTSNPDPSFEQNAVRDQRVVGIEFDPQTFSQKRWGNPQEAIIHVFQKDRLGLLSWQIQSIDYDRNYIWFGEGGGQLGHLWATSPSSIEEGSRFFVDNVYEEMSVPQEWYLNRQSGSLYYRQEEGIDLEHALIEVPVLDQIICVQGSRDRPAGYISFEGFRFAHTEATYMKAYETLPSGNWAMHRGGAVFFENTRNCSIRNCWFDALGGNAVFWSSFNVAGSVSGCLFTECGDNAICFAGATGKNSEDAMAEPSGCVAVNNLIEKCGVFGKQTAGICIACGDQISAAHNDIRSLPCSGICIADVGRGGHLIELNRIQDTLQQTWHCGSLNALGNDSRQISERSGTNAMPSPDDAVKTTTIRNNLIQQITDCGILLAAGTRKFDIYNNVVIGASIHVHEGAERNIYNNIWHNSGEATLFETGNELVQDRYHHNIAVISGDATYFLSTHAATPENADQIDSNCIFQPNGPFKALITNQQRESEFAPPVAMDLTHWQKLGFDQHSAFTDPLITDASQLNFSLLDGSPALKVGFANFARNDWGRTVEFRSIWEESDSSNVPTP